MMEVNIADQWLSRNEMSADLAMKRDTFDEWIGEKGMPAYKMDRLRQFEKEMVDEWPRIDQARRGAAW